MSAAVQPPPRIGFDWPGLDLDTIDAELIDGVPDAADLEPFERLQKEMDQ